MRLAFIAASLVIVVWQLAGIQKRLRAIHREQVLARCLTLAEYGAICPEAGPRT